MRLMFVMNSIILAGIIHAVLLFCSKSFKGLTSSLGGGGGYQQANKKLLMACLNHCVVNLCYFLT